MPENVICSKCGESNKSGNLKCEICKTDLLLNNKYYLLDILGENNHVTYLGQIKNDNRKVIIKELLISKMDNWKNKELFNREINVLKSLNHDYIPKLIEDFEVTNGKNKSIYLVIEYVEGISLREEISVKRYTEDEVLLIIEDLASILEYLHSLRPPVIHRDIKPSNIIRRKKDDKCVLIDFGAVTDTMKPEGGSTIIGTYGYMAPELFMGKPSVQSDYYSLGAVIVKLLTKKELNEISDITDSDFINHLQVTDKMKVILVELLAMELKNRVKSTSEILDLIKKYRNDSLDLSILGDYSKNIILSAMTPLDIDDEKLKIFKEKYNRLEEILVKIEKNKYKKWVEDVKSFMSFMTPVLFLALLLHFETGARSFTEGVFLFFFDILLFSPVLIYMLKKKDKSRLELFLEYRGNIDVSDEFIFLFIEKNKERFLLKSVDDKIILNEKKGVNDYLITLFGRKKIGDEFGILSENYELDEGKIILYREIFKNLGNKDE